MSVLTGHTLCVPIVKLLHNSHSHYGPFRLEILAVLRSITLYETNS